MGTEIPVAAALMVAAGATSPLIVKALSNRTIEFWLPLVTYSLPVAAGAGVGVGVGIGVGVGEGVGVGLGLPPRVLRGEMTQPPNITTRNNKLSRTPVFCGIAHLCLDLSIDKSHSIPKFLGEVARVKKSPRQQLFVNIRAWQLRFSSQNACLEACVFA